MQWGTSPYIFMFPWKDFLTGQIRKIQKHKEERDRSGKFNKTRRKEWRKEREEIFAYLDVPILMCSPLVGDTLVGPCLRKTHSSQDDKIGKKTQLLLSSS
jgi:hypothetical protein